MSRKQILHTLSLFTAVLFLLSCQRTQVPVPIAVSFQPIFSEMDMLLPFSCEMRLGNFTPHHLKFFVHDISLKQGSETVPLTLDEDGRWQHKGLALLDFEDGTGFCKNGTSALNTEVKGTVPSTLDWNAQISMTFKVGIPFALNHLDPVQAPPPLSDTSMHWSWQGGFKYFRLEGLRRDAAGIEHPYKVHLGSTGCHGSIGAITGCDREPISLIELDRIEKMKGSGETISYTIPISLDLNRLLSAENEGCMSESTEIGCAQIFDALGLDLASAKPSHRSGVFTSP